MSDDDTAATTPGGGTRPAGDADSGGRPPEENMVPAAAVSGTGRGSGAPEKARNAAKWAAGGAVVAAVLASACCWLPLVLIGVGASAVGVGGFFEAYRPYLLGATVVLLGLGFYLVYFRKPKCGPGEACETPNPKLKRFNKIMLWVATVVVAAMALFPNYIGYLLGGDGGGNAVAASTSPTRSYRIEGMTCRGCASTVQSAIAKVPGVARAKVSYTKKVAEVSFKKGASIDDAAIVAAIRSLGFRATPRAREGATR